MIGDETVDTHGVPEVLDELFEAASEEKGILPKGVWVNAKIVLMRPSGEVVRAQDRFVGIVMHEQLIIRGERLNGLGEISNAFFALVELVVAR